jgi:hypothetical protein
VGPLFDFVGESIIWHHGLRRYTTAQCWAGFWCIWGFWAGEASLADRRPTVREAQMPDFKLFLVTDEGDRRRVCGGARAVVRRCTRTKPRLFEHRERKFRAPKVGFLGSPRTAAIARGRAASRHRGPSARRVRQPRGLVDDGHRSACASRATSAPPSCSSPPPPLATSRTRC